MWVQVSIISVKIKIKITTTIVYYKHLVNAITFGLSQSVLPNNNERYEERIPDSILSYVRVLTDSSYLFHLFCHRLIFSSSHDTAVGTSDVIVAGVVDRLVVVREFLRAVEAAAVQLKKNAWIIINCL